MVKILYVGQSTQFSVPAIVSEDGVVHVGSFGENLDELQHFIGEKGSFEFVRNSEMTQDAIDELDAYLSGQKQRFTCPVDFQWGTSFEQEVWRHLLTIPYGSSTTYSRVAQAIGRPQAVRAVGSAIGKNPLSIVVPCHRVLTKDGRLGGYSGGLDMKRTLLAIEKVPYKE